ncbi:MAG: phage holin family protein [Pseudoxanthomonas sp.]
MDSPDASPGEGERPQSPSLEDSLRQFGDAGRAGFASAVEAGHALRALIAADFALARAALVRTLVWLAVAAIFGASSWLLLMATLIALLQRFGISWLASLGIASALSLAVTALGVWLTTRYFAHTRLDATRRQLAKLGIGGDDGEADE